MRVGHAAGAPFVLLDGACVPVPAGLTGLGAERPWLAVPAGRGLDDEASDRQTAALGRRSLLPLSPAHLTGRFESDGTLSLSWLRRSRAALDGWDEADPPLAEENETYRVTLSGEGGSLDLLAGETRLGVAATTWRSVLGPADTRLGVAVAQMSASVGAGTARRIALALSS
jgi:hypothetical protein